MIYETAIKDIFSQEVTPDEGYQIRPHKENREVSAPHSLTIVVAAASDNAIGRDGDMLWHIPADLRHFKEVTRGGTVVMGRKTWESLPKRPLPGRRNIVITRSSDYHSPGAEVVTGLDEALRLTITDERVYIIGGGEIYRQTLPIADCVELTRIEGNAPDADTFFPALDSDSWQLTAVSETFPAGENHPPFRYETWHRR